MKGRKLMNDIERRARSDGTRDLPDPLGRRQFLQGLAAAGALTGAGGLLSACSSGGSGSPGPSASPSATGAPRRGGSLKVGLTGGSGSDTLDPHKGLTYLDTARAQALYQPLLQLNTKAQTEFVLAEEISPHGSTSNWVIRLRKGIAFHDGKPLTADDVIFTLTRILKNKLTGSTPLGPVDIKGLKALDKRTVLVPMANSSVRTVVSHTGAITPFTMRVDQAPFNDVRVRQAMRLLVNRQQLINSALNGYAVVGADVSSPYDPDYDTSLHRDADIAQAKHLLKKAGQENLTVQLVTSAVATGTVAMATVLQQQAKAAGVTINLKMVDPTTFFGPNYLHWTFSQDFYNYSPYLAQVAQSLLPTSPFNETHWSLPQYVSLYKQANATANPALRREIEHEMQMIDFNEGGYIIPAFIAALDAYSTKITGYSAARVGQPLSDFDFEHYSFV